MKSERQQKDPVKKERLEAMLIALSNGQSTNEELSRAAQGAERMVIQRFGNASELRFENYSRKLRGLIKEVKIVTAEEDAYDGIDAWMVFQYEAHLPMLPVQIKSSDKDVNSFRNEKNYLKRAGLQIVLNCGHSTDLKMFEKQLQLEMTRIRLILREDTSLVRLIQRKDR